MSINDLYAIIIGLAAGSVAGLFGIGGAIIVVPALVLFLKFNQKLAQGTSLFMLLPPIGIFAVYQYYKSGFVNIRVGLFLIMGFLLTSYLVAKYIGQVPDNYLRKGFAVFIILIGLKMLIK